MKRSEALKIIVGYIDNEETAEYILEDLEKAGMLPPPYVGLMATGEEYVREEHQGRDVQQFKCWEPE